MPRFLRLVLTGLAILAYAVVFGEVFLRLVAPEPLVPRYVTGGPEGIRENMTNVAFRQWTPEVDVTVRYNDKGMRDDRPAPPLAKAAGECRIALVGDSYFVGFESDYPSSFAKQLEDRLAARGARVRVLNFAVSGFGTAEDLIVLEQRVAPWQPDVVVMSWHASDPDDNIRSGLYRLQDGKLQRTGEAFLPGVALSDRLMAWPAYRWLIENSHLYSAVRERAGVFTKSLLADLRRRDIETTAPAAQVAATGMPVRNPAVGSPLLDRALITASRDASKAMGAQFLLFDVPIKAKRTAFISPEARYLGSLPGIDSVSPLDAFTKAARPTLKLYLEEGQLHWTAAGNALAADVAAADIERRGWLAGCDNNAAQRKSFENAAVTP